MGITVGVAEKGINKTYDELLKKSEIVADQMATDFKKKEPLTEEDIESIAKTIDEVASPSAELLKKASEEADLPQTNEEATANIVINPVTGLPMMVQNEDDDDIHLQSFEEMLADPSIKPMDIDIKTVEVTDQDITTAAEAYIGKETLSLEDYEMIRKAADRFKTGEKFSYYNSLPQIIKNCIDRVISSDLELASKMGNFRQEGRNYIASEFLRDIVSSAATNMAVIDLEKAINQEKKKASIEIKADEYWRGTREYFLNRLPVVIEKMKADGKSEDQYKPLEQAREAFIQSYTYTDMIDQYKKGKLKIKRIQIEKFDKSCRDFNIRYEKTQNVIMEISLALTALDRNAPKHYDIDILKEFLCAFMMYTRNMNPNDKIDHVFMYYFIYNITTLDFYDKENETDVVFHDELLNNINNFLEAIVERRNKKE